MSDSVMQNTAGLPNRNTPATLREVSSRAGAGVELQQMPLPRQKYRAIVPGSLARTRVISDPLPGIHSKGKRKKGREEKVQDA